MHSEIVKHYHWHFELVPKLSIKAGFEIATGIDICITTPEYTAEFMKASRFFKI
jgi:UDPglucose--hexose-1-phosphate uridylyltransferase